MKHISSLRDTQCTRNFTARVLARLSNDDTRVTMTSTVNLISNVLNFEQMRLRSKIGNIGSTPGDSLDVTFIVQFA